MRAVMGMVAACLASAACKDKPAAAPAPVAPVVVKDAGAVLRPPPVPAVAVAAVEALLASWLAAQNAGDFDAYAALYGEPFRGVRRTGTRTVRLDRAGWLADRRKMFARPMVVAAHRIVIAPGPGRATITFEQTWSSGKFRDVGPKTIAVVATPAGLRIAAEELHASRLVPARSGDDLLATLWLAHGPRLVVASRMPAGAVLGAPRLLEGELTARDPECDSDPPDYEQENGRYFDCRGSEPAVAGDDFIAEATVRAASLPPALRALAGRELVTYDAAGAACTGLATPLVAYGERRTSDERITAAGRRDADLAAAVMTGAPVLATTAGACAKPIFARPAGSPAPAFWTLAAITGPSAEPYLAALRALDDYGEWEESVHLGSSETIITATSPSGRERLVFGAIWGDRNCQEYAFVAGIWRENLAAGAPGVPDLELLFTESSRSYTVVAVVDLDGDTRPEVVLDDGFLLETRGAYGRAVLVDFPDEFPPCLCDAEGFGCGTN